MASPDSARDVLAIPHSHPSGPLGFHREDPRTELPPPPPPLLLIRIKVMIIHIVIIIIMRIKASIYQKNAV